MTYSPRFTIVCLLASFGLFAFVLGVGPTPAPAQSDDANQENVVYDSSHFDALEYRMIGPYRGGRSTAVTGIAGKPDTYFMGTTGGGVWRTTNAGQDWHNVSDGDLDVSSIGGIDVVPIK